MNLKETLRKNAQDGGKRLDLDTLGEIMDEFIHKSKVGLLVTKEEETDEWHVEGVGCGSVVDFYIYLNALEPIYLQMLKDMRGQMDAEMLADALTELMHKTLITAAGKGDRP